MLLIHLLIIKVFVMTSCMASENELRVSIENDNTLRDKRTLNLGLLVRNLLQVSAANPPAPRKMPTQMPKMMPQPPAAMMPQPPAAMMPQPPAAMMPQAPAAMMPQAPATVPPVALPAIFGIKTYEYRPNPSYYTDKNGYLNFNPNESFVLATAIATPAPPPTATMAPPPPAPPAPTAAPQLTLKQQQQAAFINFLSTLSGFPQPSPPAPPATMPPTQQPSPPPTGASAQPPLPAAVQPGAILIPKRLLPFQQQLRENVIYKYSQPYDSSSDLENPEHYDNSYQNGQSQEHYYPNAETSDGSYYYEGPVGSKQTHDDDYTYEHQEPQQQKQPHEQQYQQHEQHYQQQEQHYQQEEQQYQQHQQSHSPYAQQSSNYPENSFHISYPDNSDYFPSKDYADNS